MIQYDFAVFMVMAVFWFLFPLGYYIGYRDGRKSGFYTGMQQFALKYLTREDSHVTID